MSKRFGVVCGKLALVLVASLASYPQEAGANNSFPGLVRWRPLVPGGAPPTSIPLPLPEYPGQYAELIPLDAICEVVEREMPPEMGGGHSEYNVCCAGDNVCVVECGADYPADPGFPAVGCGG